MSANAHTDFILGSNYLVGMSTPSLKGLWSLYSVLYCSESGFSSCLGRSSSHVRTSSSHVRTSSSHVRTSSSLVRSSSSCVRSSSSCVRTSSSHVRSSSSCVRTSSSCMRSSSSWQKNPQLMDFTGSFYIINNQMINLTTKNLKS